MNNWWSSLYHGGLLVAPSKLAEFFPDPAPSPPRAIVDRLRRDVTRALAGERRALLDTVLELVVDLAAPETGGRWLKGPEIAAVWSRRAMTGEAVRPARLWVGPHDAAFPVFWDDAARLGVGSGRRTVARVVEWLRRGGGGLALLTNGIQWRLLYAGLDHDAFAEWDAALWFEEGTPGPQVTAIRTLLSLAALGSPAPGAAGRLLQAIEATRRGQAELSAELGEQVRRAVELLIAAHGQALAASGLPPRQIYVAAVRVVMRLVVGLFAEARDLLPRDNPLYHASYGIQGLREELERLGGGAGAARLRHRRGAWARFLALFRLIHDGSTHEQLPVPAYGGGLFEPGVPASGDPLSRALAILEDPGAEVSDFTVFQILGLLTRARVKVRQGGRATWVSMPVDFGDLSSEYIGILYEGLLDFELRRVVDDPVVFLNLGDEPALPLSRLEQMDDRALAGLLEKFKQKRRVVVAESEGEDAEAEEEEPEEDEEEAAKDASPDDEPGSDAAEGAAVALEGEAPDDAHRQARERALAWSRRAVAAGRMVPRPGRGVRAAEEHARAVEAAANALVSRVVVPGDWYLVRFGGTRKGSGTFYTRPALAVPTVQRTLRPLAYTPPAAEGGTPREEAPPAEWSVRTPETILALKVCDPAAGSGSFLVAALRFLTEALAESLHAHGRVRAQGDQTLVTLALGEPGGQALAEELLPCRPDAPEFDARLRARLRRYVVERCLYGVDLDPLAVELARMALWVETMDRNLPFSFLDHKIKCGNALVGCWFDRFRDYPALAFDREGGDKGHTNGVHFQRGAWTEAIKRFREDRLKPALVAWITGASTLFEEVGGQTPETVHDQALALFEEMHALPVHETEERARLYRERVQASPALAALREAFDTWCALWFWPADQIDLAPLPAQLATPSEDARRVVRALVQEHRFFHWELEFPDVFATAGAGFNAVIGNPPWEIQKPSSKEFFSNLDPLYRAYGKQEALRRQTDLFAYSQDDEEAWLAYNARFKALSAWVKHVGNPFGDPGTGGTVIALGRRRDTEALHGVWRDRRKVRSSYADRAHPFRSQGAADVNTYKLFLEVSWSVLRVEGQLGMITPAGIYSDQGSTALRSLFLNQGTWKWLFAFENREGIFSIHKSFKFCPIIVRKGGATDAIGTAFMRRDVQDWAAAERLAIPYRRQQIERLSPTTRAFLEIRSRRDLEIIDKVFADSVRLGEQGPSGWGVDYVREFDMTNDSGLFHIRSGLEGEGYLPDEYGRWLSGRWRPTECGSPGDPGRSRWQLDAGVILSRDGQRWIEESEIADVALPLYEGRMVGQFDFSEKGWVRGRGRSAVWRSLPWDAKVWEPQYLMHSDSFLERSTELGTVGRLPCRLGFMDVSSGTNTRTMIAALLPRMPNGNKVPLLNAADPVGLVVVLNSLLFDYQLRARMGGLSINYFILEESALPAKSRSVMNCLRAVESLSVGLAAPSPTFSPLWLQTTCREAWRHAWVLTELRRLEARAVLDAIVFTAWGFSQSDVAWVLRDCDWPCRDLRARGFASGLDPKGFWRVGKDQEPEFRHTVLTQVAFADLQSVIQAHGGDRERGITAFLTQNDGDGWMLPETLRLADYDLGHDDRARQHQPVRERLGPRFYDFQLEQSAEDSWKECRLHARNLLGEAGFAALERELAGSPTARVEPEPPPAGPEAGRRQGELFG